MDIENVQIVGIFIPFEWFRSENTSLKLSFGKARRYFLRVAKSDEDHDQDKEYVQNEVQRQIVTFRSILILGFESLDHDQQID